MKGTLSKTARSLVAVAALGAGLGTAPPALASEPYLGEIRMYGFNFPPRGWAHCNGQLLSISTNTALFSLLGIAYGGDGRSTFQLPDLRGRAAIHPGTGPGLSTISWGERGGAEEKTLTVQNLPPHNHSATLRADPGAGTQTAPGGGALADDPREEQYSTTAPTVAMHPDSVVIGNTGGGTPVNIRNPFLGIYHSIALVGIYPPRN